MYFLLFIILFVLIFGYLLFTKPLSINFLLDTEYIDLHMHVKWLFPFFEAKWTMLDYSSIISIFIFKKKVLSKKSQKRGSKLSGYLSDLSVSNTYLNSFYSLDDPFETGMASVVFQMLESLTDHVQITHYPAFISDHAYLILEAGTNLNIGKSVVQIIRKNLSNKKRRKKYGPVKS